jgi:hypothetical protein
LIIPNDTSINIAAVTANGKYASRHSNKNSEMIAVNTLTSPHDILCVAHEFIFIVVLGTNALDGSDHTKPESKFAIPSPYTSRCASNHTRVYLYAILEEINVSNTAITATPTDATNTDFRATVSLKSPFKRLTSGTWNNENFTSAYTSISNGITSLPAPIRNFPTIAHNTVTTIAPGTDGTNFLKTCKTIIEIAKTPTAIRLICHKFANT